MSELHIRLGKALKLERQNKNLSLTDLTAQLKTSESTLQRIEDGDFSSFNSPVYFSLYAKSYAEAIGVDYNRTLDAIREDLGESAEPPTLATMSVKPSTLVESPTNGSELPGRRGKGLVIGIVVVALAVVAVVGWWFLRDTKHEARPTSVGQPAVAPPTRVAEPVDSSTMGGDSTTLTLSLSARGSSWVSLMTDGDTALYRTFSAGETLEVSAQRMMILTVGTPSQIDLRINGLPAKLADRAGRISNVVVTPANVRAFTGATASQQLPGPVRLDSTTTQPAEGTGR
jgi:cytoskeleton protein RodZ